MICVSIMLDFAAPSLPREEYQFDPEKVGRTKNGLLWNLLIRGHTTEQE